MAATRTYDHATLGRTVPRIERRFTFAHWSSLRPLPAKVERDANSEVVCVGYFERLVAFVLFMALAPLIVLAGIAIKLESPGGPILFWQERVGLERRRQQSRVGSLASLKERRRIPGAGRAFMIYKLRTMVPNAESKTGPVWASDSDPRITRVGRVLRHLRLDEIPQLLNVAKGQMRLIGPRPERPHFVSQLSQSIPEYANRLKVPPGITGLAQIEREYDGCIDDVRTKIKYDLFYVRNRCVLLDIKIILRTIDVMVRGRGAR